MATKSHPYTTKISYSAAGSVYTDLADVLSITPPNVSTGDTETTWLESASAHREFIASWVDSGEIPFTMYFAKAQYATILAILKGRTTYYWKITLPLLSGETTAGTLICQGHLNETSFNEITINDDAIQVPCKIKITGVVTFTAGS